MMTDIAQFENRIAGEKGFQNKTLFITGGTGFLGNVLIEKILRTCPLVEKLYVMVRAKKGINSQTRLEKIFDSPVFDLLKKIRGEDILKKVVAVPGNISEANLGLTDEYRKLITENVQIIYHMAASTRFDLSIKEAIMTNTVSTREMIKLAKECKKLLVFVHVSTAYCFPEERTLYEKVYSLPLNPDDIIKVVQTMQEADEEAIRKKYMGEHPNTYTFSKALSEMLVSEEMDNLPLIIVRPSIVIPVWKDPLPGWTNNFFGPIGLFVAGGRGILRSMCGNGNVYADFVPVDMTANALQVVAYDYMTNKSRRIFNLTSSSEVKVTWEEVIELSKKIATTKMPYNWVVWYPGASLQSSKFIHNVWVILFHYVPAIILDLLLILTANKPVLWKIQQKLTKSFHLFEYYTSHQWDFNNDHVLQVRKLQNEKEKEIYRIDPRRIDVESYIYDCIHGTRLYLLKEGDETLPTARKRMKMMWALDRFLKALIFIGIGYVLIQCFINS